MSRTGVLSDEHIMKHCSIYKPIPMGMTKSILHQNLNLHTQSPYTVKKLKYHNAVSRPATFDTLAKALTRITKDDSMRENLKSMYIKEINAPRSVSVPPSVHTPPQMTGPASIVPRSTLALPQPIPFPDPNLPTGFPEPPFQPLPDSENENENGNGNGNGGYESNGTASTASDEGVRLPGDPRAEFESPIQSPETTLSAPSPSLGPMDGVNWSNLPTSPGGTRYTRERLAMERMGFVRRERIHLQEEFQRRRRSEPYLGDYAGPGPVMMPFVQGTGEILGDNPDRENVTVDDRYIVRQSV